MSDVTLPIAALLIASVFEADSMHQQSHVVQCQSAGNNIDILDL
jgi:hypothetical protein